MTLHVYSYTPLQISLVASFFFFFSHYKKDRDGFKNFVIDFADLYFSGSGASILPTYVFLVNSLIITGTEVGGKCPISVTT